MALQVKILKEGKISKEKAFESLIDFSAKPQLLSEIVRSEMSNLRAGNAHTKMRGEVKGGGRKPWKQKGTGRARHGSSRSPIWVGGGVTHGPRNNRNWHKKINKTARLSALKLILKSHLEAENVYQIEDSIPKTKEALVTLEAIKQKNEYKNKDFLLIYTTEELEGTLGFSNLDVKKLNARNLKIFPIVGSKLLILTPKSRSFLEEKIA